MPTVTFSNEFVQSNDPTFAGNSIYRMMGINQSLATSDVVSNCPYLPNLPFTGDGTMAYGALYIMKGTVPTNLSTITLFSQRSSDVLVSFAGGGDFSPSHDTFWKNPGVISTNFKAASATGTATWFWIVSRTYYDPNNPNNTIFQQMAGTVGTVGSNNDLEIPSTSISTGQLVRVVNLRFTLPTTYTY
jgi:hypothetical protein